jgi:hypothetical protein
MRRLAVHTAALLYWLLRKHMPAKHGFTDQSGSYDSVDQELLFWKLEHQPGILLHTP